MEYQDSLEKHCQSIDFSNSCREFYMTRLKATEEFKRNVELQNGTRNSKKTSKKNTSIDNAMETLRTEMASLMDQDLSLMKQLLTLNETIEEIKFRRLHSTSNDSMVTSSCNLDNSELNVHEMNESLKVPKIEITADTNLKSATANNYNFIEKDMFIDGKCRKIIHGRGNFSLDSGYDETDDYQTDVELTL